VREGQCERGIVRQIGKQEHSESAYISHLPGYDGENVTQCSVSHNNYTFSILFIFCVCLATARLAPISLRSAPSDDSSGGMLSVAMLLYSVSTSHPHMIDISINSV